MITTSAIIIARNTSTQLAKKQIIIKNARQEKQGSKEKVKHKCPAHLVANSKTPLRASCIDFWVRNSGVVDRSTKRRRFGGDSDKNKIDVHSAENVERVAN